MICTVLMGIKVGGVTIRAVMRPGGQIGVCSGTDQGCTANSSLVTESAVVAVGTGNNLTLGCCQAKATDTMTGLTGCDPLQIAIPFGMQAMGVYTAGVTVQTTDIGASENDIGNRGISSTHIGGPC